MWTTVDVDGLREAFPDDMLLATYLNPKVRGVVSDAGWAFVDGDRAAVASSDPAGAVAALGANVARLSVSTQSDFKPAGGWEPSVGWVWMSATDCEHVNTWPLVALDDDRDATEINDFGFRFNDRFEGNPGEGRNRYWLAARSDDGTLIGCGTVRNFSYGYLSGIVVDPQWRGHGIGATITSHLTRRVIDQDGCATLSAWADATAAITLYTKLGYRLDYRFVDWKKTT